MYAQMLAMVIANSNMIFGNQGYCVFEFTVKDDIGDYSDVNIMLRPQYDPAATATAQTELEDITLSFDMIGKKRVKVRVETDCEVTGFDLIQADGTYNGEGVDLLNSQELDAGPGDLPITLNGN